MKKWHVTYYYLATGMEGVAATKDYGIVEAETEEEAIAKIANAFQKGLTWGLRAKLLCDQITQNQSFVI